MRRVIGDRQRAIELLKTTNLKYKEISDQTGVPLGTINGLALTFRPPEVREANRKKAGVENLMVARESREPQSGEMTTEENVLVPEVVSNKGLSRIMVFSYKAKTDSPISKTEALSEIANLKSMIDSATGEAFSFSVYVETKEGVENVS